MVFPGLGHAKSGPTGNTLITPDGSRIVTVALAPHSASAEVTEFSADTGQAVLRSHPENSGPPWSVLWTSPSGSTVIVSAQPTAKSTQAVVGVLRGQHFTPLPEAPLNTVNMAW